MVKGKTTAQILANAEETLRTARLGLNDLSGGDPARKLGGLRNLVVFGRAVTNVLQNLRSTESGFDEWYEPFVDEMRADDLLRFFYRLRSQILKEGQLGTSVSVHIKALNFPADLQRFGPPPPGAKGFFIGDQSGGSGWEVELPDGTVEKFYAALPGELGTSRVDFREPPMTHLGAELENGDIEQLGSLYYNYLERLVAAAKTEFGE